MKAVRGTGASSAARGLPGPWLAWVVTVLVALAAGLALGAAPVTGVLVLGLLVLLAMAALNPGFALGTILASALLMLSVNAYLDLPSQSLLLTKVLVGVFALSVLPRIRRGRHAVAYLTVLIPWVAVLTISALFGVSDRVLSLQALWSYICGPVVFSAILYSHMSVGALRRVGVVVLAIMVAQLPLVIFQNLFLATSVDQIGGTFGTVGGTSIVAIVMAFSWTVAVAVLPSRSRVWLVIVGVAIATVLLLAEAKTGFLFCALGTIAVGLTRGVLQRRFASASLKYAAAAAAAVAALFGGYLYAGSLWKGGERAAEVVLTYLTNPRLMVAYLFSYGPQGQAGRLEGVRLALSKGRPALADVLIGRGPGLLSSSALLGSSSSALSRSMGVTFDWATSLTRSILETGILGIVVFFGVIVSAVATVVGSWRSRTRFEPGASVVAAAVGLALVFVVSGLYAAPWHSDAISVTFWCLLGMGAKWGQLLSEEEDGQGQGSEPAGTRPETRTFETEEAART